LSCTEHQMYFKKTSPCTSIHDAFTFRTKTKLWQT